MGRGGVGWREEGKWEGGRSENEVRTFIMYVFHMDDLLMFGLWGWQNRTLVSWEPLLFGILLCSHGGNVCIVFIFIFSTGVYVRQLHVSGRGGWVDGRWKGR